jgi:DNA-binding SARP family transcriptional activator
MFSMSVYYLWKGEYEKNAVLLKQAEAEIRMHKPPPFVVIRIKLMKGIQYWLAAQYDDARKTLSEGLDVSAKSGVHVFDSLLWCFKATAEMGPGNLERAENAISRQVASATGKTLDTFFCHINAAWHELLREHPARAAEHLHAIAHAVVKMGNPYYKALWNIGSAVTAFLQGRPQDANTHVRTAHRTGLTMKSHVVEWCCLLTEAWFLLHDGRKTKGRETLRRGLEIGRQHGFVHLEFSLPKVMRILCAEALEAGIEREYVKWLIRKLGLTPPAEPGCCPETWPWQVRIYTLGRFVIIRDDEPIEFPGKEQKRPLELLKAVIACGGAEAPAGQLTDQLWPDADGDLAHKSFETTLARLRKLLGGDDVIKYRAGQVALNPMRCWTDSLALERLFDAFHDAAGAQATVLAEKAAGLYKGSFLPSDAGHHWVAAKRELLKNRLLRVIVKSGRLYEQAGHWELAADLYLKGLDTDYLAEEMYKRLMICYRSLGNHADAVKTYNRCRSLLKAELGIEPSAETREVYSSILRER